MKVGTKPAEVTSRNMNIHVLIGTFLLIKIENFV